MTYQKNTITIIGSGLAGSFLAVLLAKRGYKVDIYEKLTKKEICDTNSKRSYNITFRNYGIEMLKEAGLWKALKPHLLPLKGASTQLSKNAKPILSPLFSKHMQYYAVSRASLLNILLAEMSRLSCVNVHYETSLLSIDRYEKTAFFQHNKTKRIVTKTSDVIIGADGTNSLVRSFMQQGQDTSHTQEYSTGGYKQFTITKKQVQQLQLQSNIAYTWNAEQKFILAFPNFDGSLAALLVFPIKKNAFADLATIDAMKNLFAAEFPLLLPIYKSIAQQLLTNPEGGFVTIHSDPWYYKNFITLVGDAAHGFYPFFGQGTSAAFGDCMQLISLLDTYGPNWGEIFPRYQKLRKKHMDALGELSKKGLLLYMRNKRADYNAIYDKLESVGYALMPKYIQPPVSLSVMNDPEHSADHVIRHSNQRKQARFFGIPLLVSFLTATVATIEHLQLSRKISAR